MTDVAERDTAPLARVDESWGHVEIFDWLDAVLPALIEAERRTNQARIAVGQGLWLLRRRLDDREYSQRVSALASTHKVTPRTLFRWRELAEADLGLEAGERSQTQRGKSHGAPGPAKAPVYEQESLFKPETADGVRRLGEIVAQVDADDWASAVPLAELDAAIQTLVDARAVVLREQSILTDGVAV